MRTAASTVPPLPRGAAFVEAMVAALALAGIVGMGLVLVERWAGAARRFDQRAEAFATAFAGCGHATDLSARLTEAWGTFHARALVARKTPPRASTESGKESFACNELGYLDERSLRREVARRLPGGSK